MHGKYEIVIYQVNCRRHQKKLSEDMKEGNFCFDTQKWTPNSKDIFFLYFPGKIVGEQILTNSLEPHDLAHFCIKGINM